MKHKHLSFLLTMLLSMVGTTAFAHDFEVANADGVTIYYMKTSDTEVAVIFRGTSYSSYSNEYTGNVVVPKSVTYNDVSYSVTSIGSDAFYGCTGLTSVTIPNSVTYIGTDAFDNCSGLKKVIVPDIAAWCRITFGSYDANPLYYTQHLYSNEETEITELTIPNSVINIGKYAFYNCSSLTSVTIPNGVTSIGNNAFEGCSGLTSIDIPNSVTSIGWGAFADCSGLTSVTIGNSVTSIDGSAFNGCSGLTTVTIPNSVTSIGNYAFRGCSGLTTVTISNSVTSIGDYVFGDCSSMTSLILEDGDNIIKIGSGGIGVTELYKGRILSGYANIFPNLKKLTIGPSIKNIKNQNLSSYAPKVETLIIAKGVESIEENAFTSLANLKDVTIPETVTSIGCSAFKGCTELKTLTLQDDEADLVFDNTGSSANGSNSYIFAGCNIDKLYLGRTVKLKGSWTSSTFTKVTSVEMGHYVKAIPQYMFMNCNLLTDVTFGENLKSIGEKAFYYCSAINSLTLPNGLETIEANAFANCKQLKKVTIPASVTEMGSSAFAYCSALRSITLEDSDAKLTVDNTVNFIFDDCRVDYFYLGRTITSSVKKNIIENVGTLEIGDKVKTVYPSMFADCSNMDELKIGRKVESIGERAFVNNSYLGMVYCYNPVPPIIKSNTFASCPIDRLYVPKGCKETYAAADYWNMFKSIVEMDEEAVPSGIKGDVNGDGKVTITDAVEVVDIILNEGK